MPYRRAVRLGLVPGLVLVSLSFPSAANVQRKSDAAQARTAPSAKPAAEEGDAAGDERVVVSSDLISLRVTVTDKFGRSVSGLPQSAFTVFDEKRPQEISLFDEDDSPVSVGIVFDLTGSMNEGKMGRAREALARFMETSHEEDEYFLVTLQGGGAALSLDGTRDHEAVMNRLTQLRGHGETALYDACRLGLNRVLGGVHQRRALLLISDGRDNNSHYTFEELRRALTESDVSIYSISVAEPSNERSSVLAEDVLREMAEATGGKFFQPRSSREMYEAFERIALELRRQYAIGYRPSDFATDGKWHRLKVKIALPPGTPHLFVRYRSGYYAQPSGR
jgi:Ca-activated chloride channel family protein